MRGPRTLLRWIKAKLVEDIDPVEYHYDSIEEAIIDQCSDPPYYRSELYSNFTYERMVLNDLDATITNVNTDEEVERMKAYIHGLKNRE